MLAQRRAGLIRGIRGNVFGHEFTNEHGAAEPQPKHIISISIAVQNRER
jgi:hypothetical protein